jgi:hypothetical protein
LGAHRTVALAGSFKTKFFCSWDLNYFQNNLKVKIYMSKYYIAFTIGFLNIKSKNINEIFCDIFWMIYFLNNLLWFNLPT